MPDLDPKFIEWDEAPPRVNAPSINDIQWDGEEETKPELTLGRLGGALKAGAQDVVRTSTAAIEGLRQASFPDQQKLDLAEVNQAMGLETAPEYKKSSGWVEDFVRGGPQMAAQIATSIAGGPLMGMTLMGLQIAGSDYERALEEGRDPLNSLAWGMANAIMQAPLEQIGVGKITKLWKPQTNIVSKLKNIGEAMGVEWLTEFLQGVPEAMSEVFSKTPDKTFLENFSTLVDYLPTALKQSAYEGTLTAPWALLGAAGPTQAGVDRRKAAEQDRLAKEAANRDAIKNAVVAAVDNPDQRGAIVANQLIPAMMGRSGGEVEDVRGPWKGTPSEGEVEDVRGPKYVPVSQREPGATMFPSEEVPATETPDMGPTNLQKLRGMLYGKEVRQKEAPVVKESLPTEPLPERTAGEEEAIGRDLFTPEELTEFDRLGIDVSKVPAKYKEEALQQIAFRTEHEGEISEEYNARIRQEYKDQEARRQGKEPTPVSKQAEAPTEKGKKAEPKNWRDALKEEKDDFRKQDILRSIANGKSTSAEMVDVLAEAEKLPQKAPNLFYDISTNKASSRETAQRARKLYDDLFRPAKNKSDLLLSEIKSLQPPGQDRALVSITDLRDKAGMEPEAFDKALTALAQSGKVALHHHDFPSSLTPEKRSKLLKVGDTYYVGVVPKTAQPVPEKEVTHGQKRTTEAETVLEGKPGRAWVNGQFRPFTTYREISRGGNKGKVEIVSRGKKVIVAKDQVKEWPGKGETKAAENTVAQGTEPGKIGNLLLRTSDGKVYESSDPIHAIMLDTFGLKADNIIETGIISKDGAIWSKRSVQKRLSVSDEQKQKAKDQREGIKRSKAGTGKKKTPADATNIIDFVVLVGGLNPRDSSWGGALNDIRWVTRAVNDKMGFATGKTRKVPRFPQGFWRLNAKGFDEVAEMAAAHGWIDPNLDTQGKEQALYDLISGKIVGSKSKFSEVGSPQWIDEQVRKESEKWVEEEVNSELEDRHGTSDLTGLERQGLVDDEVKDRASEEVAKEEGVSKDETDAEIDRIFNTEAPSEKSLSQPLEKKPAEEEPGVREQQSLFGKPKEIFKLEPSESTPQEQAALKGKKKTELPKGEKLRAKIPEEKIQPATSGRQGSFIDTAQKDLFTEGIDKLEGSDVPFINVPTSEKPKIDFGESKPTESTKTLPPRQRVRVASTGSIRATGNVVSNESDVASLLASLRKSPQEFFYSVATDKNGVILQIHKYVKGTAFGAAIRPIEVAGPILSTEGVANAYLVHNHPSASSDASQEDRAITKQIADALKAGDIKTSAVIISGTEYRTLDNEGQDLNWPEKIKPISRKMLLPVVERKRLFRIKGYFNAEKVTDYLKAINVISTYGGNQDGVLFMDRQNRPTVFMPFVKGRSFRDTTADIIKLADSTNSSAIAIKNDIDTPNRRHYIDALYQHEGLGPDLTILDVIEKGKSRMAEGMPKRAGYGQFGPQSMIIDISMMGTESKSFPSHPTREAIEKRLNPILARLKGLPPVQVVNNWDSLPKGVKDYYEQKMKKGNYAALFVRFNNGKQAIYILADKQASVNTAVKSLWHEGGHFALRKTLKDGSPEYNKFLDDLWNSKYKVEIHTIGEAYRKDQKNNQKFDMNTEEGRRNAADEWWAREVANEDFAQRSPWHQRMWDRFVILVRKFLNGIGIKVAIGRSEIRNMMRRSWESMESVEATKGPQEAEVSGELQGQAMFQKILPSDVNTSEFKKWSKGLSIIEAGYTIPKGGFVVKAYHSTRDAFKSFMPLSHFGTVEAAEHRFRAFRGYGNKELEEFEYTEEEGENIIPAYVRMENPVEIEDTGQDFFIDDLMEAAGVSKNEIKKINAIAKSGDMKEWERRVVNAIKKTGHDGFVYTNEIEDPGSVSYVPLEPTQVKSIFNRGTWDETVADISGERVEPTKTQKDVDDQQTKDSLEVFDTIRNFLKTSKRGWKTQKPDTSWLDRIISVPLHHFQKVPSLNEMFKDGLKKTDDYYTLQDVLLKRPDDQYSTTVLTDLQKKDPETYKKVKDYLNTRDRNAIGHKVEHDEKADTYTVKFGNQTIGTYKGEEQAWSAARTDEMKRMAEDGYSKEAIDAVGSMRFTTDNGFRILMKNMRDIIAKFEDLGLPLPEVAIKDQDGETVKVDLKVALAKMGDIRGYYFPRVRRPGQYMMIAKKEGENPIMEFFDTKVFLTRRQAQLERQGYTVTKDLSPKMPEDVFQMAGETVAMQAMINQALEKMHSQGLSLDDFGLKGEYRGKDFIVTGPTTKKMNTVLKDKMGGRWYQSKGDDRQLWHFSNAGKTFEKRLATALAEEVDIIGEHMETLFAKTLAEQVANVIKGRGHRAHMIKRADAVGKEVWLGYEEDPALALAQYARGIASGEAKKNMALNMVRHFTGTDVSWQDFKTEKADQGEKADYTDYMAMVEEKRINPTKQPNAFKEAKIFMEDMLRNQEHIDRLMGTIKGIAVLKYLAGRISAPVVNLTALATSAPGAISGYANVGIPKAMAALSRAGSLYTKYKFRNQSVSESTKKLFDEIESKGWHKAQYNREALSVLESRLGRHWNNLIEYSMMMFGVSEQLNRVSTIAGAYFAMKDKALKSNETFDHDATLQKAKEISDKAHGVYNKANIPQWARGGGIGGQIAKSFYIFKTFSHNYLLTLYDLGFNQKQAKSALYMAISPMILAGSGALVGKQIITGIMQALGLGGDDPEEEFYQWVYENAGEKAENLARFGIFGAPGVSLKGSLEIGIADIPTSIKDVLGAPGSLFSDLYYGGKSIARGDVLKGVEKMSPNALGSMFRAYREGTEGLTTGTNAPLFYGKKPVVADLVDSIYRFLSFNPAKIASIREKQWKEKQIEEKYSEMRKDLYAKFKRFYLKPADERKQSDYIDLLTEVKEYNERVKSNKLDRKGIPTITGKSISTNIKRSFKPSKRERLRETEEE